MERAWGAALGVAMACLAGCGGESQEPTRDASNVDGANGGGELRFCQTFSGGECEADEFCRLAPECGAADVGGVCLPRPTACDASEQPVCACNGQTYSNECVANAAGESVQHEGRCVVSCDARDVRCRAVEPTCPEFQTASVVNGCWGPCVPIDDCECQVAEDCPHSEWATCHLHRQRCGPYL